MEEFPCSRNDLAGKHFTRSLPSDAGLSTTGVVLVTVLVTVLVPILRLEDLFDQGDYLSKLLTNAVTDEVAERRKAGQAVDLGLLSRVHGPLEPADEGEEALRAELELQAK